MELPLTRQTESASTMRLANIRQSTARRIPGATRGGLFLEFKLQPVRERFQIMRVVARVNFHPFGQRTPRPVGLLRTFVQLHAEKFFDERTQAELPFAQKPRGEHRVENRGRRELVMFFQQAQIVIRRVKNEFVGVEHVEQRIKIYFRERVNQHVAVGGADLDEADFFGIGVQAVGLGVEREPLGGAEFRQQRGEFSSVSITRTFLTTKARGTKFLKLSCVPVSWWFNFFA
jgi:hypothetical protein